MSEGSPTAEGELSRTPVAHLLVYALDRRLSGALFFTPPENVGGETIVRLHRGVPVKVKPGDGFAPLGQMLLEAKAIDQATLEAALATKGFLGDMLLLTERIQRDVLERIATDQFMRRMVRLFALPPQTTYRYYEGHSALAEHGGDPAGVDPLTILWAGIRLHGEVSTLMEPTLARLGDVPLRLHSSHTIGRFGLGDAEAPLLTAMSAGPMTATELCSQSFPGVVRRFLYALAITRQLESGAGSIPLGSEPAPTSSQRSATWGSSGPGPSASLAKVALKSTVHRVGAAAPDAPGAGERPIAPARRSANEPSGERQTPPDSGVTTVPSEGGRSSSVSPTMDADFEAEEQGLASLSSQELMWLAAEYLEQSDVHSAVEACAVGCEREPTDASLIALHAWARAQVDGADLSAIAAELDEIVTRHESHADALFYRALLLRRLGDEAGSVRDLRRTVEVQPDHEGARRALAALSAPPGPEVERAVLGRFSRG